MPPASMPWVKLYTEMLDDPKLSGLSDPLKWRFVQMVLLAGECDREGWLASSDAAMKVDQIAWRLRTDAKALERDLVALKEVGLMACDRKLGAWCVTNFQKRQGRPQSKKRETWRENKRRHRSVLKDTDRTPSEVLAGSPKGVLTPEGELELEESKTREEEEGDGAGAPPTHNPNPTGEASERSNNSSQPADLPAAVKVFEANGGKYARGELIDGTSKKERAQHYIAEHVRDTPESLALWKRVVYGYTAQWSGKSYTIMIDDYYLRGRVPGESGGPKNGAFVGGESRTEAAVRAFAEKRGLSPNGN